MSSQGRASPPSHAKVRWSRWWHMATCRIGLLVIWTFWCPRATSTSRIERLSDWDTARGSVSAQEEENFLNHECALPFRNDASGHIVELHWRLCERNASVHLPVGALWQRVTPVALPGMTVSSLAPEDLVLYLCVHGAKHRWERLEWVACVAEIVRNNADLDWHAIFEKGGPLPRGPSVARWPPSGVVGAGRGIAGAGDRESGERSSRSRPRGVGDDRVVRPGKRGDTLPGARRSLFIHDAQP